MVAALALTQVPNPSNWTKPIAPFRAIDNVHYVGTEDLASWLVTSPGGHVLVDAGVEQNAPHILAGIKRLGFNPRDVKVLLTTQAHFDHVGTHAHFKKLSGAMVQAMDGDAALLRDGGKSDYLFANDANFHFPPVSVDRVLKDGDLVTLGGERLTARRTPGHTPGSATYEMEVNEAGRIYKVVFAASTSVNPGTRLVKDPSYPGILEDYRQTFQVLASLKPDIWVSGHSSFFDLAAKRKKLTKNNPAAAFVDPDGYQRVIEERRKTFEDLVAKESGVPPSPR